jgi:hypothetical protein
VCLLQDRTNPAHGAAEIKVGLPRLGVRARVGYRARQYCVAVADNTSADQTTQTSAHKQFMKGCMTNARAANNGTSEQDMKKACKDQLKSTMGNPDQPVTPAH